MKDLRQLRQGQIVVLDQVVGEPLAIFANGHRVAVGEVVSVAKDQYGIRVDRARRGKRTQGRAGVTQSEVSIGAWVAFAELAAPLMLAMLIIGLVAGVLQTMTQIREASIAFILKLACVALLTTFSGPLMMRGLERYATTLITAIPSLIHG